MKQLVSDLAIFGAPPAFTEALHVGRPNIGNREKFFARANEIFDRRWLTNNGPFVQELERRIAELVGVGHCVAMCNATVALEITARALELTGEVIVPSFTFVATAHALQWQQLTPVFCDIDPLTHTLDPAAVRRMITPRTSGIVGVHIWGRPCAIADLDAIAREHELKLIFDAAHAFACSHRGRRIGSFGDAEIFSFHATKFFNTFEGGAVVTNNDELATRIRLMKNFGFAGYDSVVCLGTNAKMSEMAAAMGLVGLDSLQEFIAVNYDNYRCYLHELQDLPGIVPVRYDETEQGNYQYVVVEVDEHLAGIGRDDLVAILHAENVMARRYFFPGAHRMEPYRSLSPDLCQCLPVTESLVKRVMSLPTGTAVGKDDIVKVCRIIRTVVTNAAQILADWEKVART